jgi:Group II intron, maturase-specific domain
VSKRAFHALDSHVWRLVYKWASFSHPNKPKRWIIPRYFGLFNASRQDKWVFGSQESGFYLRKFAWTKMVRHRMIAGRASPDDPALTDYWTQRRRRTSTPVDAATWRLLHQQHGRCPLCQGLLLHADGEPQSPREWQQWLTATRTATRKHAIVAAVELGRPNEHTATHLIHTYCRRRLDDGRNPALPPAREPTSLLEPVARKRARPVLRVPRAHYCAWGYPTSDGSDCSPTNASNAACTRPSAHWKTTSATGSKTGTRTQGPSLGPRPPTRSSNASPHILNEFPAQDTRSRAASNSPMAYNVTARLLAESMVP